jgi:putative transposase
VLSDRYIKQELKRIFKMVCQWKGFTIHAWHVGDDHIHLFVSIPPKYSVAYALAVIKGKSSAWLRKKTNKFPQGALWERGYFVSTVGVNEQAVRQYVNNQHLHHSEMKQLSILERMAGVARKDKSHRP